MMTHIKHKELLDRLNTTQAKKAKKYKRFIKL